ncbi:PepSY domain-containing protein [Hyphomonas sp.]|uniref:PepSY domain-containing protein n=1 Tax=Hyphomonas sp. TaxID=87 RepID=UPI0032EC8A86
MRIAAMIAVAALALPGASFADDAYADDDRASDNCIAHDFALDIAYQHGLVRVDKLERDDDQWEIEGDDASGQEIEIDISCEAEVLEVEYDD